MTIAPHPRNKNNLELNEENAQGLLKLVRLGEQERKRELNKKAKKQKSKSV
jgi:hypothetical protein